MGRRRRRGARSAPSPSSGSFRRPALHGRHRRGGARSRHAAARSRARPRPPLLARRAHARRGAGLGRRAGSSSPSRCRSRCSRTPGWRPSPTSPRRPAARARPSAKPVQRNRRRRRPLIAIAVVGLSAFPPGGGELDRGTEWLSRRCSASPTSSERRLPAGSPTRCGSSSASPARSSCVAATTSVSGCGTLAYSLASTGCCPARSAGSAPDTDLAARSRSVVVASRPAARRSPRRCEDDVAFLAALFGFRGPARVHRCAAGRDRLRFREPELERPFRVPERPRRGRAVPIPRRRRARPHAGRLGRSPGDHPGARYAGPAWLAPAGLCRLRPRPPAREGPAGASGRPTSRRSWGGARARRSSCR